MPAAIRVEKLGKRYHLHQGRPEHAYRTLRESLTDLASAPLRRWRNGGHSEPQEEFWALEDVSFEVQPGEVVGIIGRNGAGKSTLLKVLSRITRPTTGRVALRGRVGSLLEVGTGFHPELTGRENVYLNGSILGMSRREIGRKFDEIVAFAEIEKFLDTPVKRYSSGMYVRLAFAVAAHLDPEILVVDEVLAVGDAVFQKKCLGKMREVSEGGGRTVLFVSHNMNAVLELCQSGVLLRHGRLASMGPVADVVREYADRKEEHTGNVDLSDHPNRDRSRWKALRRIELLDKHGSHVPTFEPQAEVIARLTVKTMQPIPSAKIGIGVNTWKGQRIFAVATPLSRAVVPILKGEQSVLCHFKLPSLIPGSYELDISIADSSGIMIDEVTNVNMLQVTHNNKLGTTQNIGDWMGSIMVKSDWDRIRLK